MRSRTPCSPSRVRAELRHLAKEDGQRGSAVVEFVLVSVLAAEVFLYCAFAYNTRFQRAYFIDDQLSRAMVIDPTTLSGDKVVFGATVTLTDEDKKKIRYQLVGQTEADAKVGRISYNSPLGRALIGHHVGEEVEVSTPSGDRYYKIKAIEFV